MAKGNHVLSTGEVAKICYVAPRTVQKWFDSGLIKGYRIPGGGDRRIPIDDFIRFLKEYNMPYAEKPEILISKAAFVGTSANKFETISKL